MERSIEINNLDDVIDVRDIIARIEQLEELEQPGPIDTGNPNDADCSQDDLFQELAVLWALIEELKGNGEDEQWRGDWYPLTLIRDSYFNDSMDELLEDIGELPKDIPSYLRIVVDYDALQMDYSSVEFEGITYWYR